MEGLLIRRWDPIVSGWRLLYEHQVEFPHRAVRYRPGGHVFVPGLLVLKMRGEISDPGRPYPLRVVLVLRTAAWGFRTVREGIDPGITIFFPDLLEL